MSGFNDDMKVSDAREEMRKLLLAGHDEKCPVCAQNAKVYKRKIHATMAKALITIYNAGKDRPMEFLHLPTVLNSSGGDTIKAKYWGLIEDETNFREDGSPRTGYWRLTFRGRAFVEGRVRVQKHARVYNGTSFELVGEPVTIGECLGTAFRYDDLMAGR